MTRWLSIVFLTALSIVGLPAVEAVTEDTKDSQSDAPELDAAMVANRAIADIASWNLNRARTYLEEQRPQFGSTPEFQTAWALFEAREGQSGDQSQLMAAVQDLEKRATQEKFSAVANFWRGELFYEQGNRSAAGGAWSAALAGAEKAVEKDPEDATAQFYLGAARVRNKQFEPARESLEAAEELGFDRAMVRHQIGLSYLFSQQWAPAREAFDAALEAEPTFAPSYFWRAMAWDKLGRKDNMLIDLDQFVKLAPDATDAGKARAILSSAGR